MLAATGNFASYLEFAIAGQSDEWQYNFHKVTIGSVVIYCYMIVVPTLVWVGSKFWAEIPLSVMDNFCLYGYSLFPYIPAAVSLTECIQTLSK